ncbi:MAG: aminotransferase class V-fold PLP-dependent enzyme [Bacteroidales bacterium]|nr:aminotransferase class V-fold PLP-dependent enzyme [Bacteroidales bacterium]
MHVKHSLSPLENHFNQFSENIIGHNHFIKTPNGEKRLYYADWIASGRLYRPIEEKLCNVFGPMVANTHTESSDTGIFMTKSYHHALNLIKKHVNAGDNDAIITFGSGMTAVINKFQRILGLKYCGLISHKDCNKLNEKPVVFITHMEHHSNHTSWMETVADVVVIPPGDDLLIDLNKVEESVKKFRDRRIKIGSFTACSNVTGIDTPYYDMAAIMHKYGGLCFVDFAASAPYCQINMHPPKAENKLDAIFFSPHKFLGGPGSSGVLIFDTSLYNSPIPDNPGGGTVDWTNPWGEYKYVDDIEAREDGGTPGFLQAIRTALCIELKLKMGIDHIKKREEELLRIAFEKLDKIEGLKILADNKRERLGIISFYILGIHYNLVVRLLNDHFGIQVRGGCACAGTYGHFLLNVSYEFSKAITTKITSGDLSEKPGWVRLSLHPTMTNEELLYILEAIKQVALNKDIWSKDYVYNRKTNEFLHKQMPDISGCVSEAFSL